MGSEQVRLVYAGEVLDGHAAAAVHRALIDWLRLDPDRREALAQGRPLVIKRGVPLPEASRWVSQFRQRGARLQIQPLPPSQTSTMDADRPSPAAAARPSAATSPRPGRARPANRTPSASAPHQAEARRRATTPPAPPPASHPREPDRSREGALSVLELTPLAEAPILNRLAHRDPRLMAQILRGELQHEDAVIRHDPTGAAALFSLGLQGRLDRSRYAAGTLLAWVGAALLWALALALPGLGGLVVAGAGTLALLAWGGRLSALRLHDLGQSAWWALPLSLPGPGTVASVALMLKPGLPHANAHGAPVTAPLPRPAWLRDLRAPWPKR